MSDLEKSERPWGRYEVLQESSTHKVKCIWMKPGSRLSYQRHKHRAEHWFIVQGTGEVTINGEVVSLPLKEFELLEFLMRNAGRVLTRSQLIDRVWGGDYYGDTKTLDVHIKRLRAKIEDDPANPVLIQTIRGLGYKLESN